MFLPLTPVDDRSLTVAPVTAVRTLLESVPVKSTSKSGLDPSLLSKSILTTCFEDAAFSTITAGITAGTTPVVAPIPLTSEL